MNFSFLYGLPHTGQDSCPGTKIFHHGVENSRPLTAFAEVQQMSLNAFTEAGCVHINIRPLHRYFVFLALTNQGVIIGCHGALGTCFRHQDSLIGIEYCSTFSHEIHAAKDDRSALLVTLSGSGQMNLQQNSATSCTIAAW